MMGGLTTSQFEKLARLGAKMDGRKVLVRVDEGISGLPFANPDARQAYYTIEVVPPRLGWDDSVEPGWVALVPVGGGSTADSRVDRESYQYTHGGDLYRVAVDAAKDLATALGA